MSSGRPWAWPLVPVYWSGLRMKDALRAAGILRQRRLGWPVVSVGSLSAGGAGKTPVVIALAEMFRLRGWHVDVLSRGYKREGSGVELVDLDRADAARRFGDEPVLIAEAAQVPVWVGAQRFAAGACAEAQQPQTRGVHLLDDGFQHRQLARAYDIVLVTEEDFEEPLLPAGNRREPLAALRRADAIVVRDEELPAIDSYVRRLVARGVPIWAVRRTLVVPAGLSGSSKAPVAFCGIARPRGFFAMLRAGGVRPAAEVTFPDHHTYTFGDVSRLVKSCNLGGGGGFVTTGKDAVRIGPALRAALEAAGSLHIAELETRFSDPEGVMRTLEERLR